MKKIYFSLITIAILLFGACTNDGPVNEEPVNAGKLKATISFETKKVTPGAQAGLRGGETSTAIPVVSWDNVTQMQLFLYQADGTISFSQILRPSEGTEVQGSTNNARLFEIPNVPIGNYKLALLANTSMATNKVITSLTGVAGLTPGVEFSNLNVVGKKIEDILVDVKGATLPDIPVGAGGAQMWGDRLGYDKPSEVFTAFVDAVTVSEGETEEVKVPALRREISLMRTRFDITTTGGTPEEIAQREKVNFDTDSSFIVVQRLPEYFNFATGMSAAVNNKKVFVAATGTKTYRSADPDENPPAGEIKYRTKEGGTDFFILNGTYTRWNDFYVFPNAEGRPALDASANIEDRQYFIIISAWVELQDGETYTALSFEGKPAIATKSTRVYWWALVNAEFKRNQIREVNLTLKTPGYLEFPTEPTGQGNLEIEIGEPEPWNPVIVGTNMDI